VSAETPLEVTYAVEELVETGMDELLLVTGGTEYDAADPDEYGLPWDDQRVRQLWSIEPPIVSARDTR
jgi:dTDP-4-dehydrorhamnose 3,5-epimerase-like enzyme